jgi:HPt (histidine-containing phosphotransfer) domain-containing protein
MFRQELPRSVASLREAVAAADAATVRRVAHTLKSSCLLFGAQAAHEAARRLEALGRAEDLRGASEALAELEGALAAVEAGLASWADGRGGTAQG